MTVFIENDINKTFDFDYKKVINDVIDASVTYIKCPFEVNVEVTITDDENIKEINKQQRNIDCATDVLSFPIVEYEVAGDFSFLDNDNDVFNDCFDPDTGELMLGDIVLSADKIYAQADEYGHSVKREMAFLVAHSMLHLFGYDHMEDEERIEMENMQENILNNLGITRD